MSRLIQQRPVLIGTFEMQLEDKTLLYSVKRSSRAKHVRFEVRGETGLTVVIPHAGHVERLPELLAKKRKWILSALMKCRNTHPPAIKKEIRTGDSILYLFRHVAVLIRHDSGEANSIVLEGNQLIVNLSDRDGRLDLIVERWYRQQAEKFIQKRTDELCSEFVTYSHMRIRGAKTRWGSCSRKGNLSFNWKLMMVPGPIIDYVIIHELAHLREMNHSSRFWKTVAERCPHWRECRRWLKEHEAELLAIW